MARFDSEFNAEIRRTINSFNQKVRRAEKRGEKGLPKLRSVREFKAQYSTKKDAKRELSQLQTLLNNKQALQRHRTKDGTISNWEFDYIVNNLRATDRWITREINKARERYKDYPDHLYAIREDINRLLDEKAIINRDLNKLTARELRTVSATIERYKRRNVKISSGREYFMRNLDILLTAKGLPKTQRQEMYKKLDKLTNDEFEELYKRHDVMTDVFLLVPSPTGVDSPQEVKDKVVEDTLNNEIVTGALEEWAEQLDNYIDEAKTAVHSANETLGEGKNKITYKEWMELTQ